MQNQSDCFNRSAARFLQSSFTEVKKYFCLSYIHMELGLSWCRKNTSVLITVFGIQGVDVKDLGYRAMCNLKEKQALSCLTNV